MFKNIISSVCYAIALLSGILMIENVAGMKSTIQTDEIVRITERPQFFAMTLEQAEDIKAISFKGQNIDESFCDHWCTIFSGINFNHLSFDECSFTEDSFFIFEGVMVTNLAIIHCGIKPIQVGEILRAIDPYSLRSVSFSYNNLGIDKEALYRMLCEYIGGGRMHLDTLDLRGNSLTEFPYDKRNVAEIFF